MYVSKDISTISDNSTEERVVCMSSQGADSERVTRQKSNPNGPSIRAFKTFPIIRLRVPLQAGEAYIILAIMVARATSCRAGSCEGRVFNAYMYVEEAHDPTMLLT